MSAWKLRWTTPEGPTESTFGSGVYMLGSGAQADVRINDRTVSRRHCRFTCSDDGILIEDLGSTNGTRVDGERVDGPVRFAEAASLKVGSVVIEISPVEVRSQTGASGFSGMSSGASMLLGPATVGFLRDAGEEVAFSAEEVIIRRGDHQDFFYVVIEGQVELLLNEGEARKRPLARLGEGGIFGAESVLAKEGAAIDAVAVTDVRLLRYPASALPSALQESASLAQETPGRLRPKPPQDDLRCPRSPPRRRCHGPPRPGRQRSRRADRRLAPDEGDPEKGRRPGGRQCRRSSSPAKTAPARPRSPASSTMDRLDRRVR